MAKFVDGSEWPVDTYSIVNSKCDCFGAARHNYCKHLQILSEFRKLQDSQGITPAGVFYCHDTNTFYVPEDGEGIPLQGCVQIQPEQLT